jgi:phosphoribosylanthranilate isomerase
MGNDELDEIFNNFTPDYIQCHGNESVERIEIIKTRYNTKIIKAFSVRESDDIAKSLAYKDVADIILYDAKAPKSQIPGGNGLSFDWNLIKEINFDFQWMLSGGLNFSNLTEAIKTTNAEIIDLSSAVESSLGVKDNKLIKDFLQKAKSVII